MDSIEVELITDILLEAGFAQLLLLPLWTTISKLQWLYSSALGVGALVDLYTAASLVLLLLRSREEITPRGLSMLNKAVMYIVGTGALTSFIAISDMILVLSNPGNLIFFGVFCVYVYGNSLLVWLNARSHIRNDSRVPSLSITSVRFQRRTRDTCLSMGSTQLSSEGDTAMSFGSQRYLQERSTPS
ncbi:uncharacterized protein PHACADRAFT_195230 [Phanerochaete carnosa HHB-10118-sp]|uniref:DUF6534 domain-containing protein n=1 Tax=Phanerochaete carnosa (strain HHB-10118-sp) TaxID=650164 RepID=K5VUI8_PHACS|nr:uncharacterized protein PHACADRAFT_195230 [Phanerochaete carnosa HHB-10118-sp]EKM55203.1 hypothetical protein PHACADRAFT_195230 [Phanerochaete carnosa HHB-10118-sp]